MKPLPLALWLALAVSCVLRDDPAGLGANCIFNGDCADPLVCAGRRCRAPCRDDRDCTNAWRCRGSGVDARRVCLPPDNLGYCRHAAECSAPFVCRTDGECAAQCRESADCRRYSPSGLLQCITIPLPEGGSAGVCENHPWLRDGGAPPDARSDATADLPRADVTTDASADATADARADATADAPRMDSGASPGCPTTLAGTCQPGPTCALVSLGLSTSGGCALFADGSLRCWQNAAESPGTYTLTSASRTLCVRPAVRFAAGTFRSVDANAYQGCGVTAEGLARCWGGGLLGDGVTRTVGSPEPITVERYPDEGALTGVTAVSVGIGRGTCAVAGPTRRVFCWGQVSVDGSVAVRTRATEHPTLDEVDQIAAQGNWACALRRGAVWCFGSTGEAAGSSDAGAAPTRQIPLTQSATQIALGGQHTCAVLMDRAVTCFGEVWLSGTKSTRNTPPTPVAGLRDVEELVALDVGSNCARRTDGSVWCWGYHGVLGDGSSTDRAEPRAVPGLSGVQRLWGRARFVCASTGTDLWCWGESSGIMGSLATPTPTRVSWGSE